MASKSLTSRPLDLVYLIYFLSHIPATLLLDIQAIVPKSLLPDAIRGLGLKYINMTNDPVVGGATGLVGNPANFAWLRSFMYLELFFQLPIFILGARALWKRKLSHYSILIHANLTSVTRSDTQTFYLPMIIYGASTATTTLACLAVVLNTPVTSSSAAAPDGTVTITSEQRNLLLGSYLPYLLIPLVMAVDCSLRVSTMLGRSQNAVLASKTK
ncbi:hypothetical protein HGRIS_004191 [Hohenbuehelia grisea]|uniref:EXPERA domain-containing protein n=1 Tax=Hohenbuehelia grisea TaxID=104357 RepID=A0ABR3JHZ2_9AGAR